MRQAPSRRKSNTRDIAHPLHVLQAECDLSDPKCALDSLLAIQARTQKDPRIPEKDKLTEDDVHLMTRDFIIAGLFECPLSRIAPAPPVQY